MIQQTDSESVLRRYVAAVQAGDEKAIRELFAEDATWTVHAGQLPISGTWTGATRSSTSSSQRRSRATSRVP